MRVMTLGLQFLNYRKSSVAASAMTPTAGQLNRRENVRSQLSGLLFSGEMSLRDEN